MHNGGKHVILFFPIEVEAGIKIKGIGDKKSLSACVIALIKGQISF